MLKIRDSISQFDTSLLRAQVLELNCLILECDTATAHYRLFISFVKYGRDWLSLSRCLEWFTIAKACYGDDNSFFTGQNYFSAWWGLSSFCLPQFSWTTAIFSSLKVKKGKKTANNFLKERNESAINWTLCRYFQVVDNALAYILCVQPMRYAILPN